MKKLIILLCLAAVSVVAQDITVVTNTVVSVQPITLTPAQMDGIITAVQNSGISANVKISSTNLQGVYVNKIGTNFVVNMRIK